MSAQRVLVTGGAGFIGSHLVEALLTAGHEPIIVLDDLSMGARSNLTGLTAHSVELLRGDVRDAVAVRHLLDKIQVDTVCHLATRPLVASISNPSEVVKDIVEMHIALLEAQRADSFGLLVSFSTSEIYGFSGRTTRRELDRPEPRTPYAAAKAFGDQLTQSYGRTFGTKYVIIRPFNNYGPRKRVLERAGIIPTAIQRLASGQPVTLSGSGLQARDYVYVTDTARAVLHALHAPAAVGEIINVATGVPRTMRSVVEDVAELMGMRPAINYGRAREGDVGYLCGDGRKARTLLGFAPTVPWEQGLANCIEYYAPLAKRVTHAKAMH